jgi:hypothetical protein
MMKTFSEHAALEQAGIVYDLDAPDVETLKTIESTFFGSMSRHSHVHELSWLKIGEQYYLAKSEDVFLNINRPNVLNYSDFQAFCSSIFEVGEYFTPERIFRFPEEPETNTVSFSANNVMGKIALIRSLSDHTPISSIEDNLIRQLFILYLSKKERLVELDGKIYDNVFNHRGRDILNEVIASIFAKFLQVKIPNNFFGIKSNCYRMQSTPRGINDHQARSRYVLSKLLTKDMNCQSLDMALNDTKLHASNGSGFSLRFPSALTNANPLGIRHFSENSTPEHLARKKLIQSQFVQYSDLIYSDFFDRLLGGWQDRKLQEYLLPQGQFGPIYTVDYGEILFPELEFERDDPHYLIKREQHITSFISFLEEVAGMASGNIYKATIAQPVFLFTALPHNLFRRLISKIPAFFFQSHWDDCRYAYNPDTLVDFFEHLKQAVREWLGYSNTTDSDRLYCVVERVFS